MAAPRQQEWNIRPRANACTASGRPFEDGDVFHSRLMPDEEGFLREDYSAEAWTDELKNEALSTWQGTFLVPPPPEAEPLKPETVEDTLRKLMEGNEPEDQGAIFILAMQLERKRQLIPRARQRKPDGTLLLFYEHKQTGETFLIPNPEWSLEEIGEVQAHVARRLGWLPPVPDPASDPAAGAPETADNQPSDEAPDKEPSGNERPDDPAVDPGTEDPPPPGEPPATAAESESKPERGNDEEDGGDAAEENRPRATMNLKGATDAK